MRGADEDEQYLAGLLALTQQLRACKQLQVRGFFT
jgi:hypothetical protein